MAEPPRVALSTIGATLGLPTSRVVLAVAGGVLLGALQVATRT